ncbi:MAG: SDR family NAD(P)-dependent oxidoreductase [bacterium]|nr:SDR family NAD(P)-dependent oxidoreductase [bacterium]
MTSRSGESIAVVGMACRFPQADDLSAFWRLLETGTNAVIEGVPGSGVGRVGELFSEMPEKEACRFGAYLDQIDEFDAEFFRISPTEAQMLDPQQRLMLETSWQALEDAGIDPDGLKGSRTGVYAGISSNDYRHLILVTSGTSEPAPSLYAVTGTSYSTAIGRVAFALGLEGPAMAVDTACSSSLVAVHQAAAGLRQGEADLALVGGVHAMASGRMIELRANAGMLAPDGQCKAFDASANGYVRGEGCGMVVLKRLSDAEADGDRIWGVVLGSAVNQDGASSGLTVPMETAQQQAIEEALHNAGVVPADIDYLEAHGTGTPVGDPIEVNAAAAAYRQGRDEANPLLIGSVKTNIGHLEAAAGVAGLIKTVLAMNRGTIPRHLNLRELNPKIDWEQFPVQVTTEMTEWPSNQGRPPRAGVNSFGFSGTNAHVVLEGYPDSGGQSVPVGPSRPIVVSSLGDSDWPAEMEARLARLLPLSGKSPAALQELAERHMSWLDEQAEELAVDNSAAVPVLSDMAWTAGVGRSHQAYRAGVVFRDAESLREKLSALLEGETELQRSQTAPKVAFAYTGQGSQWIGMGQALYDREPVVREVLDRCDRAMRELRGTSLLAVMFGAPDAEGDLDDPAWTQPAIYALECALTELWASLGVGPDVVVGHSLGEIAASRTAGVFSLEDGLRFAAGRGALMAELPEPGAMAGVFAPPSEVAASIEEQRVASGDPRLAIAADNGAHQMISGPTTDVEAVLQRFEAEEVRIRRLEKSAGYHSAMVEPILDGVEALLVELEVGSPSLAFVSSMLGRALVPGEELDSSYWRRQARQAVEFRSCVETLATEGVQVVIEVGPGAVLGPMTALAWPEQAGSAPAPVVVSSMKRPSTRTPEPDDRCGFMDAVAGAYQAGLDISYDGLFAGEERRRVSLPSYPFQRQRYWVEGTRRRRQSSGHPLLGVRHDSPRGESLFETEMFASDPAWLADHRVFDRVVMPGALYGAMAASAQLSDGSQSVTVEDWQLYSPLIFSEEESEDGGGRSVQLVLEDAKGAVSRGFEIFSKAPTEEKWTLHAQGQVSPGVRLHEAPEPVDLNALKAGLTRGDVSAFYQAKAESAIDFGPSFRTLQSIWLEAGEAVGEVVLPPTVDHGGLDVHPILLDGCFQVMSAARSLSGAEGGATYMPFGCERFWLSGPLPERLVCHVRMRDAVQDRASEREPDESPEVLTGDIHLYDPDGIPLGGLSGYTVKRATRTALLSAVEGLEDLLYEVVWRDADLAEDPADVTEPPGAWLVAADQRGVAEELAAELAERNQTVVVASHGEAGDGIAPTEGGVHRWTADVRDRESWRSLIAVLPEDVPLRGVVHLAALDGHGHQASTEDLAEDVRSAGASALALTQGLIDAGVEPTHGLWLVTKGAQVLGCELVGELAGATLWGMGKSLAREAAHLKTRMVDLDPEGEEPVSDLVAELFSNDGETHIAHRAGSRRVARLIHSGAETVRMALPEEPGWRLAPDPGGSIERLAAEPLPPLPLASGEVRVGIEAAGLNFRDVLVSMGMLGDNSLLGREMCGVVLEVASDVTAVSVGDRVVGLGFGTFAPETVTRAELVAPAPPGIPAPTLATVPLAFTTAAIAFELAGLKAGDRVLVHAGTGGVGLAAIQLAQAAGAEVFATASTPKQAYLRSLGVAHVFDSRQTAFGDEITEATGGEGVHVVLNSLTGEGFIEASLSCLADGGRFVELGRRGIWSQAEMSEARPDVEYSILELDVLKVEDPDRVGASLSSVMEQLAAGELKPLVHRFWPLAEASAAMEYMQSARHIGKNVLVMPPLAVGRLRDDRTYLVTGGLGGIGCEVAEWLVDQGATAIVLNGRRPPDNAAQAVISGLRERGAVVQVELADVTDSSAVDQMLSRIDDSMPPLGGVIHSVGVLSDGSLSNLSWARFEQVLGPKVLGAWHLHSATKDRDLDLFLLFSSITSVLGKAGQANHSAANAFLDQLAAHRRAQGLSGQSIAWGAWSELGEAEEQRDRISRQLAASGTGWITPQQGMKALDRLVRQDAVATMVGLVDWPVFTEGLDSRLAFFEELLSADTGEAADEAEMSGDLLSQLGEAAAEEREALLTAFLQQELQAVMKLSTPPSPTADFSDLGMDSLIAVELRNRLNRAFAGEYMASNTVVFDYPDVSSLARHLAGELDQVIGAEAKPEPVPQPRPRARQRGQDGIAIVGMACRFPGAEDLSAYWRLLEAGENAVTDGRQDEGSWSGVAGDPSAVDVTHRRGAFVEGIDRFDSSFFRISPIQARMMDPVQRMLLETSWHALEDAGMDPAQLKGSRTGVFAGVGDSEYRRVIAASGREDTTFGTVGSVAVGRVAFVLGLEGPAMPLNLACASSLAAIHQAVAAFRNDEIDLALVGAANAVLSPAMTRFLDEHGLLSPDGQCKAFDASADGYVRGEGCGMVVLKRLGDAEADGDRIWGVVLGSAVNQNGASLDLILPNGRAQQQVIQKALERAGVEPSEVDYMEAHGLGTMVGDPAEVDAAGTVYGQGRDGDRPLLIGSVKTNIGHLEFASGIASLIKTVLAMRKRLIPRQLHFENPNPQIDWDRLPVQVTTAPTEWPLEPDRPPIAAVHSLGISGTNAHVVLEGYPSPHSEDGLEEVPWPMGAPRAVGDDTEVEEGEEGRRARLLPLSGKSDGAVRDMARGYLRWLDDHADLLSSEDSADSLLSDMAWTASIGRSHFSYRTSVVFRDEESLRAGLRAVVDHDHEFSPCEEGGVLSTDGFDPGDDGSVKAVGAAYEAGQTVDFEYLFSGERRRRLSLPSYPFQRRRHWVQPRK